jgi:hypothetical protein
MSTNQNKKYSQNATDRPRLDYDEYLAQEKAKSEAKPAPPIPTDYDHKANGTYMAKNYGGGVASANQLQKPTQKSPEDKK